MVALALHIKVHVLLPDIVHSLFIPGCSFPTDWIGAWFVEGEDDPVTIDSEDLGERGHCVTKNESHTILYNR